MVRVGRFVLGLVRLLFGIPAGLLLIAALGEVALTGQLTFIGPGLFAALLAVALAHLIEALIVARKRSEALENQTNQFKIIARRLEAALKNAAAINARLNRSESRYKGLVDAQGDAIFRRDGGCRLTYGNEAFFHLFGLTPSQAIGYPFAPESPAGPGAPTVGSFAALESGRARVHFDQQVRTATGLRWIAWEDYAVRDSHGRLMEVQSVGRDVTERKVMEAALTAARDQAQAASRAKSSFLAAMSHEIRTPMNGVLGMARLLKETALSPEQHTYVDAIGQSGEALLTLINDILDFSKIEAGMVHLEEGDVDLHALMNGVSELLCPRAHAKGVEVSAIIAQDVAHTIRADEGRLRQIITNLMGNAIKFTERGGVCVEVTTVREDTQDFLRFEIRDTGVGVAPAKRQEIFREFVQADASHARKFGGTGLGLAISRRLVEAMGGTIGVEEAAGGGSCFWFTIPQATTDSGAKGPALGGLRVAVMSANPVLEDGLSRQIAALGGHVTGRDTAQIILIDAGTEDTQEIAAPPDTKMPSLVLLAPTQRGRLAQLHRMGFAGYLIKPVRQESLADQLLACLHKTDAQAGVSTPAAPSISDDAALPPFVAAFAPPHAKPQAAPPPHAPAVPDDFSLHILLAEDNPVNMMLIRELLRRRGHRVAEVTSGQGAVEAAGKGGFDLLLTDIHMPGMDGIEAARAIRALEEQQDLPRIPIVALTADALDAGKEACRQAGMDGFLIKPVDPLELEEMFGALFPRREGSHIVAA
jgi:PAS domain S-box-containing protein